MTGHRIQVNAIESGVIAADALTGAITPEMKEAMGSAVPLRRLGDHESIAATIVQLASTARAYVTGEIIEVDGDSQVPPMDAGVI